MNAILTKHPVAASTADNRSSIVVVLAAVTMILSVVFTLMRTLIAIRKKIQVRWDDVFILIAMVGHAFS